MKLFFFWKYGCKLRLNKLFQHFIRVFSDSGVIFYKRLINPMWEKEKKQEYKAYFDLRAGKKIICG